MIYCKYHLQFGGVHLIKCLGQQNFTYLIVNRKAFRLTSFVNLWSLQLHVKEDALVNFKSELAVLELEVQVVY